jgi:CheY-specific phosphatase CheX
MDCASGTEILLNEMAPIVSAVFETMLDIEVAPGEAAWKPGPDRVIASVHLAGAWTGVVDLECDQRQACRFAARFLGDDDRVDPCSITRDVLGELINMIGGNLKCALTSGILLSSPWVTEDGGAHRPGASHQHHMSFECSEGTFWVGVLSLPS